MPGQVRLNEEQIEKMKRLQAEGATTQQLAVRFQCSVETVRVYCPPAMGARYVPSRRISNRESVLEGAYRWGHQHQRGGKRVPIKPRLCGCAKKLGAEGCGGLEYVPTSRGQKYRTECSRRIWEIQHGRPWPEQKSRTNAMRNAEARSPRTDAEVVRNKRWEPTRPKQYICQTCYGLPHAEERRQALARYVDGSRKVSLVGCPECGGEPGAEQIERKPDLVSSASWAMSV